MLKLRDYQVHAIKALFEYLRATAGRTDANPLIQIPTGGGKSLIQANIFYNMINICPTVRILALCHSTEIIKQNHDEFIGYTNFQDTGIYCGKLKRKDSSQILFSSIQSIAKSDLSSSRIDFIFIDEAHLCNNKMSGQYRHFIEEARKWNPKLRIVGMTATPWRMDGGCLLHGEERLFTHIVDRVSIRRLVKEKYLSSITTPDTPFVNAIDYSELKINRAKNDYTQKSSGEAVSKSLPVILPELIEYTKDRNHVLLFCPTLAVCDELQAYLEKEGCSCAQFIGSTSETDRKIIKQKFEAGEIKYLISVDAITTGFNAKCVDCLVCLRPTKSSSLWIQIVGRGMRIYPDKEDCLLLDYGQNVSRHGSLEEIEAPAHKVKRKSKGTTIELFYVKTCISCNQEIPLSAKSCPECGHNFPVIERKFNEVETNVDVLFDQSNIKKTDYTYKPNHMEATLESSYSQSDVIRVKFYAKNKDFNLYFNLQNADHQQKLIRFYEKGLFRPANNEQDFQQRMQIIMALTEKIMEQKYDKICENINTLGSQIIPDYMIISYANNYPEIKDFMYA